MRHGNTGRKFGRESDHRQAMLRNLADALLQSGRIFTTLAKAKEIRKIAERLITLGKKGTLPAKRNALNILRTKEAFVKLFGEYAERFKDRNGGYTRVIKSATNRNGDNAPMAYIEYVTNEETKKVAGPKRRRRGRSKAEGKVTAEEAAAK